MNIKGSFRALLCSLALVLLATSAQAEQFTYTEIIRDLNNTTGPFGAVDIGRNLRRIQIYGDGTSQVVNSDSVIESENALYSANETNLIERFGLSTRRPIGWTHQFVGLPPAQSFESLRVRITAFSVSGGGGDAEYEGPAFAQELEFEIDGDDRVRIEGRVVGTLDPGGPFGTTTTTFRFNNDVNIGLALADGELTVTVRPTGSGLRGADDRVSVQQSRLDVVYTAEEARNNFFILLEENGGNLPTFGAPGTAWEEEGIVLINFGGDPFGGEFPNLFLNPPGSLDTGGVPLQVGSQAHGIGSGFFPGNSPHLVLGGGETDPALFPDIDPLLQAVIEAGLFTAPEAFGIPPGEAVAIPAIDLINHILVQQGQFGTMFTGPDIAAVLFPGEYVEFNANGELSENIFAFDPNNPLVGAITLNFDPQNPGGPLGVVFTPPVPEPATCALLLAGLALIGWRRRRCAA